MLYKLLLEIVNFQSSINFFFSCLGNKWRCDCDLIWMEQLKRIATNTELLHQLNQSVCTTTTFVENGSIDTDNDDGTSFKEQSANIINNYLPNNRDECWRKNNPHLIKSYSLSDSYLPSSSSPLINPLTLLIFALFFSTIL